MPRKEWATHHNLAGLAEYRLGLHALFRRLLDHIGKDVDGLIAHTLNPARFGQRLPRFAGLSLQNPCP